MSDETADGPGNARGRPFPKGQSPNPAGRPKGSRNRTTLALQATMEGNAEALLGKANEMALAGNPAMLQMFLKLLLRREQPISFELTELHSSADAAKLMKKLLEDAAAGEITLAEAERVRAIVDTFLRTLEADDFDKRLRLIEDWHRDYSWG